MYLMPKNLDEHAAKFWKANAARCFQEGTLNDCTHFAFTLLCRTAGLLANLDPLADEKAGIMKWVSLNKSFERQSIQFGISSKTKIENKPQNLADVIKAGMKTSAKKNEKK